MAKETLAEMRVVISEMQELAIANSAVGGEFPATCWEKSHFSELFYKPTPDGRGDRITFARAKEFLNAYFRAYRTGAITNPTPTTKDLLFVWANIDKGRVTPASRKAHDKKLALANMAFMRELPKVTMPEPFVAPTPASPALLTKLVTEINGRKNPRALGQKVKPTQAELDAARDAKATALHNAAIATIHQRVEIKDFAYAGEDYSSQLIYCDKPGTMRWCLFDADYSPILLCEWAQGSSKPDDLSDTTWVLDEQAPAWVAAAIKHLPSSQVGRAHLQRWIAQRSTPAPAEYYPVKHVVVPEVVTNLTEADAALTAAHNDIALLKEQLARAHAELDRVRGSVGKVIVDALPLLATAADAARNKKVNATTCRAIVIERIEEVMKDMTNWQDNKYAFTQAQPKSRVADLIDSFESDWIDE